MMNPLLLLLLVPPTLASELRVDPTEEIVTCVFDAIDAEEDFEACAIEELPESSAFTLNDDLMDALAELPEALTLDDLPAVRDLLDMAQSPPASANWSFSGCASEVRDVWQAEVVVNQAMEALGECLEDTEGCSDERLLGLLADVNLRMMEYRIAAVDLAICVSRAGGH